MTLDAGMGGVILSLGVAQVDLHGRCAMSSNVYRVNDTMTNSHKRLQNVRKGHITMISLECSMCSMFNVSSLSSSHADQISELTHSVQFFKSFSTSEPMHNG